MQEVKEILIQKLSTVVKKIFPSYGVNVYGSHATGLCLHWSDIDLVVGPKTVDGKDEPLPGNVNIVDAKIKDALRRISDCLK